MKEVKALWREGTESLFTIGFNTHTFGFGEEMPLLASLFDISFFFEGKEEKCVMAIARTEDLPIAWENFRKLLSHDELERIGTITSEKIRRQYCLSRLLTKKALGCFIGEFSFSKIGILNEKSGCPFIYPFNHGYATSITHSSSIVASLVFRNNFSFGIDVESLREEALKALKSIVAPQEPIPDDLEHLTVAWTLKESLSKALKSGFRLPFEEFALSNFSRDGDIFRCLYEKHPEFEGMALFDGKNSLAFSCPRGMLSAFPCFNRRN
jgi:phosphopantetheinyl transferase